ncbi:MAG TPA: kelch repeat-containing protein, partial [Polyangia bacterium]|nr:kelch repeat-containing protein [Polyangia bacterium]
MPHPARLSRSLLIAAVASIAVPAPARAAAVATWELVSPQRPIPRKPRATVYDRVRKKVVMMGQGFGEGFLWEWNGTRFEEWLPNVPRPDAREIGAAYDTDRNRLMVLASDTLWELDSATQTWQQLAAAGKRPPPRLTPLLVYGNKRLYVHGGEASDGLSRTILNDLWSWDPATSTWTEHTGLPASTRSRLAATWDAARACLIVAYTSGEHDEWDSATGTWSSFPADGLGPAFLAAVHYDPTSKAVLFFGSDWAVSQWAPATHTFLGRTNWAMDRSPRSWYVSAYDEARGRFVFSGGVSRIGQTTSPELDDTWEWNPADNTWSHAAAARPHPSERALPRGIYLPKTGQIMIAGGADLFEQPKGPTSFLWDPGKRQWSPATSSMVGPQEMYWPALAYDSRRDVVVLFGGVTIGTFVWLDTLWELSPATGQWTLRPNTAPWPIGRGGAAMTYDEQSGLVVMQGGLDQWATNELTDGWTWDGASGTFTRRPTTGVPDSGPGSLFYDGARDTHVFVSWNLSVWERPRNSMSWALQGDFATPRRQPAISFDTVRRKIVANGGTRDAAGLGPADDLWEWDLDRRAWSQVMVQGPAPSARWDHVMVFDPARGKTFLYGGYSYAASDSGGGSDVLGDAWELTIGHLPAGERCESSHADRCESGACMNGRCCASAETCRPDGGADAAPPDAAAPADARPLDGYAFEDRAAPAADAGAPPDAAEKAPDAGGSAPLDGADAPAAADDTAPAGQSPTRTAELYSSPGCAVAPGGRAGGPVLLLLLLAALLGGCRRRWLAALLVLAGARPAGAEPVAHWEQVAPPGLIRPTAAVYDTIRSKVVAVQQTLNDPQIWDWDGQRWTAWFPEGPRPDLRDGAITYDSNRGRLVLVTSERDPTQGSQLVMWELDPTARTWQKVEPAGKRPRARWSHSVMYDPDRRRLYLFEGYTTKEYQSEFLYEAWEWDATTRTWSERPWDQQNAHPGPRVYDPTRARLVSPVTLGVVYEWAPADGTGQLRGDGVSTFDQIIASGYDPLHKEVVAFGENREVWTWNPVTATFVVRVGAMTETPPRASWGAYAYDAARGRFVFVGGTQNAPQTVLEQGDDTWEWEPATNRWSHPRATQPNPGGVANARAVYLPGFERILMAGGDRAVSDGGPTWVWAPGQRSWSLLTGSRHAPQALRGSGLAYDPGRAVVMLFGGVSLAGQPSDQLWELRLSDSQWSQPPITSAPPARWGA